MLCRWCLSYVSVMSWWCFGDVSVISRLCFVCVSWMIRWYLRDVSVILWWCVKMFSACASNVLVIFKWCVGDVSGVSRWCVVIALWCFGDMWVMPWFCVGDVSALCRWCCGVSVMGGDAAVIVMILWCFGDEYWWTFWDFQWVPKKKGWLFDVSFAIGVVCWANSFTKRCFSRCFWLAFFWTFQEGMWGCSSCLRVLSTFYPLQCECFPIFRILLVLWGRMWGGRDLARVSFAAQSTTATLRRKHARHTGKVGVGRQKNVSHWYLYSIYIHIYIYICHM